MSTSKLRSLKGFTKKVVKPSLRKVMTQQAVTLRRVSIKQACLAFGVDQTSYRYQTKLQSENQTIASWLINLTDDESDWGFGLCFHYLHM